MLAPVLLLSSSSNGRSKRQTGHVLFVSNHGLRQSGWYMWPHGMNIPLVLSSILSQHTVQQGGSRSLPRFLQCFFSISTIGSFSTADFLALFALYLYAASYSLIRLIISKRSSEAKFWLKLLIKLFGLKSLYCICMRRNSRPLKTSIKLRSKSLTRFSI